MLKKNPPKRAVVLMNLGGPDSPAAVRPFLYQLFSDPHILSLPWGIRQGVAQMIAWLRAPKAQKIYKTLGGASPLLPNTRAQGEALEALLSQKDPDTQWKVFVCMRYWSPFVSETIGEVSAFGPDTVTLLPLYPQFSYSTTASSLHSWREAGGPPADIICCYPQNKGWIQANQALIAQALKEAPPHCALLFSAHGLPEKQIHKGDPYAEHIQLTVEAVREGPLHNHPYEICYQSRVGPLKWLGPSLEESLLKIAQGAKSVIVIPISFVSEHSETLVELDHDYAKRAAEMGIVFYRRVPAVACHPLFIEGLAEMVLSPSSRSPCGSAQICSASRSLCWNK